MVRHLNMAKRDVMVEVQVARVGGGNEMFVK